MADTGGHSDRRGGLVDKYLSHPVVRWSSALASHFFRPEFAGRPVWVTVTESLLADVSSKADLRRENFVRDLLLGPPWDSGRGNICQQALRAKDTWRSRQVPYPPYFAYLCLFSLAAATETGDRANAYYPRLRKLLGERERTGTVPGFHAMAELWDDLENWAVHDKRGGLGVFHATPVGAHRHIGYPIAQQLLTPKERTHLPDIFAAARLQAGPVPSQEELAAQILNHAGRTLSWQTIDLLKVDGDPPDRHTLLDQVSDILMWWRTSGRAFGAEDSSGHAPSARPALRLTLAMDRVAETATFGLRLRLPEVPSGGIALHTSTGIATAGPAAVAGWSELFRLEGGSALPAEPAAGWLNGRTMASVDGVAAYRLPGGALRAFGEIPGLRGRTEVETAAWPGVLFLVHAHLRHDVETLAEQQGARTSYLELSGLPADWRLANIQEITDPDPFTDLLPRRAGRVSARLLPAGGLASAPGRRSYFSFAPPFLRLVSAPDGARVVVGRKQLGEGPAGELPLPERHEAGPVVAVAWAGDEAIAECRLEIHDGQDWRNRQLPTPPKASGRRQRRDALLAPGVRLPAHGALLVGRIPGQACDAGTSPDWDPIWVLPRVGPPVYCGSGTPSNDRPGAVVHDHIARRLWSRALAERNRPMPSSPMIRELWEEYQAAARGETGELRYNLRSLFAGPRRVSQQPTQPERSPGDLLLWAVTGWGGAGEGRWRDAVKSLAENGSPDGRVEPSAVVRDRARRWMLGLGHCEDEGVRTLSPLVPYLATLPAPGLPQAVLCGARSPRTLMELHDAAETAGASISIEPQSDRLGPARFLVTANEREVLSGLALQLGLAYRGQGFAAVAAELAPDLRQVLAQCEPFGQPEPSWQRRDFDPDQASFVQSGRANAGPLRLSEYTNPRDQQRTYLLWDGGKACRIDRDWGRLAAACAAGRCVLQYNRSLRAVRFPATAFPPWQVMRPLMLCTGLVPEMNGMDWAACAGVPPWLFDVLVRKTCLNDSPCV